MFGGGEANHPHLLHAFTGLVGKKKSQNHFTNTVGLLKRVKTSSLHLHLADAKRLTNEISMERKIVFKI